jgi:rubredoxin
MVKSVKPAKKGGVKTAQKPVAIKKKSVTRVVKKPVASGKKSGMKTATVKKKLPVKAAGKKPAVRTIRKSAVSGKKTTTVKKKTATKISAVKQGSKDMTRYRCKLCGYIYSPMRGEPHHGIPEGTPFDDLPDDYVCPVCGQQGKGRIGKWGFEAWRPTRYLCSICNYIYDEKRGEPHRGIKPGTKFEDLPDDYVCPVCALDPKIRVRFGKVFKQGFEPLNF